MKLRLFAVFCSMAFFASAAPMKQEGAHTVRLSTGEIVKVAFNDSFDVDKTTRKSAGGSSNLLFQSSAGVRIAMRSRDSANRKVDTAVWSADGPDKLGFETDLEFRKRGLSVPLTVDINGERTSFLVNGDAPAEDEKIRAKLAPQIAKLSPGFTAALKELIHLGQGAYPHAGAGWTDLRYLFSSAEVSETVSIVSSHDMTADERQQFVGSFSSK